MNEQNYKLKVVCKNCNFCGEITLEKGVAVDDSVCPECGCRKLVKQYQPIRIIPNIENYS